MRSSHTGRKYEVMELGLLQPHQVPLDSLLADPSICIRLHLSMHVFNYIYLSLDLYLTPSIFTYLLILYSIAQFIIHIYSSIIHLSIYSLLYLFIHPSIIHSPLYPLILFIYLSTHYSIYLFIHPLSIQPFTSVPI